MQSIGGSGFPDDLQSSILEGVVDTFKKPRNWHSHGVTHFLTANLVEKSSSACNQTGNSYTT